MPVIGILGATSAAGFAPEMGAFRQGLQALGYREGQNVTLEQRWANNEYDRLPALAADLVGRQVTVISAIGGNPVALAAKAATTTIPVVFYVGADPVQLGLVASLNRPRENVTGIAGLNVEVGPKRLELLHEMRPTADTVALLVNPTNPNAEKLSIDLERAAQKLALILRVLHAKAERDFDTVFAGLAQLRAGALLIGGDGLFRAQSKQLAALTVRYSMPSIFQYREFAAAGGLMSYGGNIIDSYRLVGIYTARILKGEKPANLPVQQSTKAELIINIRTAKLLGIEVPATLLARADEVIEMMIRREFFSLLGCAAAVWPFVARAQQTERIRRIGVLTSSTRHDATSQARLGALQQGLHELGWEDGRNLRIEYRWAAGDPDALRKYAAELVALAPDVILANGSAAVTLLLQATRLVPIVFTDVPDPVGAGFVDSLARPGRNGTGFMLFEYGMSGKWLELLTEIAPGLSRAAVLRDPTMTAGIGQFAAIQAVAPSLRVELHPIDVRDATEIDRAIPAFARGPNDGLIVASSPLAARHRNLIIKLAATHRLPAVYSFRYYVMDGGLISYGPDPIDPFRRAAEYVDRLLKGERPTDLPVQQPTKYETVLNLKTAKALGLEIPPSLLARADEVIE